MGILDIFKRKKEKEDIIYPDKVEQTETIKKIVLRDERANQVLEEEIQNFFPEEGSFKSNCFTYSSEVSYENLPCNLRDNAWLSKLLFREINKKGVYIPEEIVNNFIDNSETFAQLRHDYELKIVKWQIDLILSDGKNWLIPRGYNAFSMRFSSDVDKIVRGGVVKTLTAIGIDREVIEEGLEINANTWRLLSMKRGFRNVYEPVLSFSSTKVKDADKSHKQNWLADREYQYYKENKRSVDKYGSITPAMQMTNEEHLSLVKVLKEQNKAREKYLHDISIGKISNEQLNSDEDDKNM